MAAPVPVQTDEPVFFKQNEATAKRGIPEAIFIENVEAMCANHKPTDLVAKLQELHSKYQYMQSSLIAQRASLKAKLPDIVSALDTVNHLLDRRAKAQEGQTADYTFQLSENIWSRASAAPTDAVCLWLGANCMLEYTLDEAVELLKTNETNAKTTLKSVDEDVAYLRDQITTTEVNIARTHNYGVKLRQKAKDEGKSEEAVAVSAAAALKPAATVDAPTVKGTGAYTWKQERDEVEVSVRLPKDAQKSDIKVTILADSLKVEHSGKVLLEGELSGKCSPDGSTWTLTGSRVEVTLVKSEPSTWASLFEIVS